MPINIPNRWTGAIIKTVEADTLEDTDLTGADLRSADLRSANLTGADLRSADLRSANLTGADLTGANLRSANLRSANLTGADLTGANLTGANLENAVLPGFAGKVPETLEEAAVQTRDWLAGGHWLAGSWIQTPTGAYAGDCLACLHGAARYIGGPVLGNVLSNRLTELGFTVAWNDERGRTVEEVCAALDRVATEAAALALPSGETTGGPNA
jgi:hypothetical protein